MRGGMAERTIAPALKAGGHWPPGFESQSHRISVLLISVSDCDHPITIRDLQVCFNTLMATAHCIANRIKK